MARWVYGASQLTRECMEFFMIALGRGTASGNRFAKQRVRVTGSTGAFVIPAISVCARIFITDAATQISTCFGPVDLFYVTLSKSIPASLDENRIVDIALPHTRTNRISFQIYGILFKLYLRKF